MTKTTDAQTLRNRPLKEHFDFEGDDVAAYEQRIGKQFKIHDDAKCDVAAAKKLLCEWAKPAEIDKWRVQNGKVPISLDSETINDLRQFKQGRILDKALAGISDPALAQAVKNDLLQISNPTAQDRIGATDRLLYLQDVNPGDAKKIREAVKQIAARPKTAAILLPIWF